jgi:hypothetical protein
MIDRLRVTDATLQRRVSFEIMGSSSPTPVRASSMTRAGLRFGSFVAAVLLGWAVLATPAAAQTDAPAPPPDAPAAGTPIYSAEQLDQLLAPVALYPDDLLGQILMAATYPLEVVQADRWLQEPSNASLRGSTLAQALQSLPWDASVKSLVAYPQILAWMDSALDWTEAAGDAFLAQQSDVMDSVQRLRARARAAGTLSSTPQETVTTSDQAIQITSPDSTVEYVPVYSPQVAYGPWPYPDYPPYDFAYPGYAVGTFIAFPILVGYWGWDHCDWRHHRIDIDNGPVGPAAVGAGRHEPRRPVPWRHDPEHRGGVPYRDPATRARFEGGADGHSVRSNYRGYYAARPEAAPSNQQPARQGQPGPTPGRAPIAERPAPMPQPAPPAARAPIAERPAPMPQAAPPAARAPIAERPVQLPQAQRPAAVMPHEVWRPSPAMPVAAAPPPRAIERPAAPALESFGRGAEVHTQELRGESSRAAAPAGGGGRGHR